MEFHVKKFIDFQLHLTSVTVSIEVNSEVEVELKIEEQQIVSCLQPLKL